MSSDEPQVMSFWEYQQRAAGTGDYPEMGGNLIYPALGLVGEAGEAADKIKKLWRNKGIRSIQGLSAEDRTALMKELGDVLWYLSAIATELHADLGLIAQMNIVKLEDRKARGVIKSEGDNR